MLVNVTVRGRVHRIRGNAHCKVTVVFLPRPSPSGVGLRCSYVAWGLARTWQVI